MHKCIIEIVINHQIDQVREVVITSSHSMLQWTVFRLEEVLSSCYSVDFHVESAANNMISVLTPIEKLPTEEARDEISLLKCIQDRVCDILSGSHVEVCMTFAHATTKDLVRHKMEALLQNYALQIHATETAMQHVLKNTTIPLDDSDWLELDKNLGSLMTCAHEAKMILSALE